MIYNVSSILRKHEHRTLAESNHDASFADESDSGVLIRPVAIYPDPFRNRNSQLVLCDTLLPNMNPHPSNTRVNAVGI